MQRISIKLATSSMKKLSLLFFTSFFAFTVFANGTGPENGKKTGGDQATAARPDFPGTLKLDIGFNFLSGAPESMELNWWGSKSVDIYYMYDIPIANSRFTFNPGIGLGLEKYRFENAVTLAATPEGTVVNPIEGVEVQKSKLAANYLDIPLEVKFHFSKNNPERGLKLAVGGKIGVLYGSHMKVKFDEGGETKKLKQKESFGLNPIRYGATARLGLGSFNLFYYHGFSELFESGEAPEGAAITPYKFGLSITLF